MRRRATTPRPTTRAGRVGGATVLATALIAPLALVTATPATAGPPVPPDQDAPPPDRGFGALINGQENGEAALTELGSEIADAAARNGMTVSGLTELLREDSSAWVDATGRVFFIDKFEGHGEASTSDGGGTADRAPYPYDQTFQLASKPSSKRTIYLDFNGELISGTAWNKRGVSSTKPQPAFDTDGSPTTFSHAERDVIQSVWQRVSEDYAPFDVNVTTSDPGNAALRRTSAADQVYGVRALITPAKVTEERLCFVCAGVAYIGTFDEIDTGGRNDYFEPAWVFPDAAHSNAKDIAETVSHEVGHNLGLEHDGLRGGREYYDGHAGWAPIMGSGYSQPVTQWSKGEYDGANNGQDDISVMGRNGVKVRPDDHGDAVAGATQLEGGTVIKGSGVVTSAADEDYFKVVRSCAGTLAVTATPAPQSPNLDIRLRLLDGSGTVLDTANPASSRVNRDVADGLGAGVSAPASTGSYYVEVDGVGEGTPGTGYSAYASIGSYTLQANGCGAPAAPTSLSVSKDLPSSTATLAWQPPTNDGGHPLTGYTATLRTGGATTHTVVLGADARSHTFNGLVEGASYTAQVAASNQTGTGPSASTTFTMVAVPPSAPTSVSLAVSNQDRSAYLHWRPPTEAGDSPVTGYVVQRTGGDPQTLPASARSYAFDGLAYGTKYAFTVQAISDSGAGPTVERVATLVKPSPPSAPRDLRGTPGDGFVTLDWRPPRNAGTSRVTAYEFTAYKADGTKVGFTDFVETKWLMGSRSNPEWMVWDLRNGQAYKFGVKACSKDGCSKKAWTGLIKPRR